MLQLQVLPAEAANKTLSPSHTRVGVNGVIVATGSGFTVTTVTAEVLTQVPVVTVTLTDAVALTVIEELV